MTFDDRLRSTFDALAKRVREETDQQLAALTAEFSETIQSERTAAAAHAASEARRAAEEESAHRLTAAIAAAVTAVETREREAAAAAVAAAEVHKREAVAAAVGAVVARERDAVAAAVRAVETREREAHAAAVRALEAREREATAAAVAAVEKREREAAAVAVAAAEAREQEAVAASEIRERAAVAAAEARTSETAREAGRVQGREQGLQEGLKEGRYEGRVEGRVEGREEGREEGRLEGRRAGHELGLQEGKLRGKEEGRLEGRQQGITEGREQGRREGLAEGLAQGLEQGKELGRADGRQEGRKEGLTEGLKEGRQEAGGAANQSALAEFKTTELTANERLLEAIRTIDAARSLTEVLDALASSAGREAARVAVLIVRSGQLRGWRFIGFNQALERNDADVPTDEAGVIAEAARTGIAVSADSAVAGSMPSFAELPPGRELLAIPVQMSGQVIAVLYADQGASESAGSLSWPTSLELMARHAARCLEAITAYRAAQVLTERPELPSMKNPAADSSAVAERAEDDVQAARRYARLLVSEIKLYHETAVLSGRQERDLATRLGGEIARARALYEQRVPGDARSGSDYFHDELVRTLADGDATLLDLNN